MKLFYFFLSVCCSIALSGCASSDASREVSSNVDKGVQNAKNLYNNATSGDIANSYANASQTTKGAFLGGATGALASMFVSGVGFLPGTATGAVLGATYGHYIDANASLKDRLENRGGTVVELGDQILIIFPSWQLFSEMTPNIKPSAYPILNLVSDYINQYTKMLVKVSAFTNDTGQPQVNLVLSQQQAESVAKYLQETGVDARVLYSAGYGGSHLVDTNVQNWEGSDNYRIEITLEKLYV